MDGNQKSFDARSDQAVCGTLPDTRRPRGTPALSPEQQDSLDLDDHVGTEAMSVLAPRN